MVHRKWKNSTKVQGESTIEKIKKEQGAMKREDEKVRQNLFSRDH